MHGLGRGKDLRHSMHTGGCKYRRLGYNRVYKLGRIEFESDD